MPFRANEAEADGLERALEFLVPRQGSSADQRAARDCILELVRIHGPAIEAYPDWHPLVSQRVASAGGQLRIRSSITQPGPACGYPMLDHVVYFRNAFLSCPYGDGQSILNAVDGFNADHRVAQIRAEVLDVPLYGEGTTSVLVSCEWARPLLEDGTVPPALVIPLLLESELPNWRLAQQAETWESLRSNWLGQPCGRMSSLFINQQTATQIKRLWNHLIANGVFGPIPETL